MSLLLILRGSYFGGVIIRRVFIIAAGALVMASPSFSLAADENVECNERLIDALISAGDSLTPSSESRNSCHRLLFNFIANNPHLRSTFSDEKKPLNSRIMMMRGMGGIYSMFKSLYEAEDGIHAAAEDVYKTAAALGLIRRAGNDVEILDTMPKQLDAALLDKLIAGASANEPKKRGKLGQPFRKRLEAPAEASSPAVPGGQVKNFYDVFFALGDELERLKERERELAGEEDLTYRCLKPSSYDVNALTKAAKRIVSTQELRKEEKAKSGGAAYEAALDYFDWELSERLAKDYVQVSLIFDRADELLNLKKEGLANIPAGKPEQI